MSKWEELRKWLDDESASELEAMQVIGKMNELDVAEAADLFDRKMRRDKKPLAELKTIDEVIAEAITWCDTRKEAIGFVCLWEESRRSPEESCYGLAVELLLNAWEEDEA